MMVVGGIFPTFPDAEHGKTWLKPWNFRVVKETADEVTVSMSLTDDFAYAAAPKQFNKGATGIEATYYVTLKAGRAALDTRAVLKNPHDKAVDYEYWTCTTLAPVPIRNIPRRTERPRSSRRSRPTPRRAGRPTSRTVTRARARRDTASKNCATSGTGRPWASPMPRRTCRAAISGA
jgi:hypothetical protein